MPGINTIGEGIYHCMNIIIKMAPKLPVNMTQSDDSICEIIGSYYAFLVRPYIKQVYGKYAVAMNHAGCSQGLYQQLIPEQYVKDPCMPYNKVYMVLLYYPGDIFSASPIILSVNFTEIRDNDPLNPLRQWIVIYIRRKICDDDNLILHASPQGDQAAQNPLYTAIHNGVVIYAYRLNGMLVIL